jgi:hypothetical protein
MTTFFSDTFPMDDGCPLHVAMGELAQVSVAQHVLYLEGECLPRPELLAELECWSSLHSLIRDRICVASRTTPLTDPEFESAARSRLEAEASQGRHRRLVRACAVCNQARCCPLGADGEYP